MATNSIPAKVQRLLKVAAKYNELVVIEDDITRSQTRCWVIRVAEQIHRSRGQVWVYWSPAANGGSVRVVRYCPITGNQYRITQAQAPIAIALLAGH